VDLVAECLLGALEDHEGVAAQGVDEGLSRAGCAVKAVEIPMVIRSHPRPGRAGCRRGLRTSPVIGPGACKSRAVSNVHDDGQPSEMGYHRCHGEGGAGDRPLSLKPMLEASVWKESPLRRERCQSPVGFSSPTGCARHGRAAARSRVGRQSVQPGVKSDTYSTTGISTRPKAGRHGFTRG
jgi:hypothetical protein